MPPRPAERDAARGAGARRPWHPDSVCGLGGQHERADLMRARHGAGTAGRVRGGPLRHDGRGRAAFLGASRDTGFALTVLAAAVAALTLEPLRVWLRRRLPEPPQDRLARLARSAVEAGDLAEVLQSTARLLQEGLAAASVEIRPVAAGAPPIVARATALLGDAAGVEEIPLARSGRLWGRLRVPLPPDAHMLPRDQALLAEVAEHIATMLQTAALRNALRTVAEAGGPDHRSAPLTPADRARPARGPAPGRARHPRRRAAAS